jgi:hypothetical protein
MPLKLSDSELEAVMAAARPISVDRRDAFLQEIASSLQDCAEIGPGAVYRAIAATQRHFFDPPDLTERVWGHRGQPKRGRRVVG